MDEGREESVGGGGGGVGRMRVREIRGEKREVGGGGRKDGEMRGENGT